MLPRASRFVPLVLFGCSGLFGQALLENFSTTRYNYGGTTLLWSADNGDPACTGQTWDISGGTGNDHIPSAPGNYCPYVHFFPNSPTVGYTFPQGYAQYFIESGNWSTTYNRLTYTMTCGDTITAGSDGFATYIRDHATTDYNYQGQHYYHSTSLQTMVANQPVTWVINATPNHRVSTSPGINWPNDPEWVFPSGNDTGPANPTHYFDGLTRFYLNPTRQNLSPAYSCSYSNFNFSTTANEPDEFVYTLMGQYDGSKYNVAWYGPSNNVTAYTVKYSTTGSLKSLGFSNGTSGGPDLATNGDSGSRVLWQSASVGQTQNMWIAIRPKPSVVGATGTGVSPVRLSFAADPMYAVGDSVTVSGVGGNTAANGAWSVTPVPRQFWQTANGSLQSVVVPSGTAPVTATVTTANAHNLKVGQVIMLYNQGDCCQWDYALFFTVLSVPSSTTFTISTSEPAGTYTAATSPLMIAWSLPALDLTGTTGNGTFAGGGAVVANSDTKGFTELFLPASTTTYSPCDINKDGLVNAVDVSLIETQALGTAACTNDLNGDGKCDVTDVQRVINASSGGACKTGV